MTKTVSRVLYFTYPTLVLALTFLGWASANQSKLTGLTLPPLGGEYIYFNPSLHAYSCEQKNSLKFEIKNECKNDHFPSAMTQYTDRRSSDPIQKTN